MAEKPAQEIEIDVEVLPPSAIPHGRTTREQETIPRVYTKEPKASSKEGGGVSKESPFNDPFIALVARLMDSAFTIPGTGIRFGLDPIIGLIAGYGDAAAALTSLVLLARSVKYGIPRVVIAQMALNIVLNATVGAVPVVGDAFSFWFKSNERNYELLRKHASSPSSSTRSSWLFVGALILGVCGVLLATIFAYGAIVYLLIRLITGGGQH